MFLPCSRDQRLLATALQARAAPRGSSSTRFEQLHAVPFRVAAGLYLRPVSTRAPPARGERALAQRHKLRFRGGCAAELAAWHRAFQFLGFNRAVGCPGSWRGESTSPPPWHWEVPRPGAGAGTAAVPPLRAARCRDGSARVRKSQVSVVS